MTTDPRVRRAFERAAGSYDAAAEVQRRTVQSLVDALPASLGSADPTLLDVGCGTGAAFAPLLGRFPAARLLGIDFSIAMLRAAAAHGHGARVALACADAARLPAAPEAADLVFSSMTWQWCAMPQVLGEAHRTTRPGGTLAFSTLIAGTFHEVDSAFRGIDAHPHTLRLLDRVAVLAAVAAAGFGDARVHAETRVARYATPADALRAIRAAGASELGAPRRRGLLGKAAWRTVESRWLARADADRRVPLSYEVLEVVATRRPEGRAKIEASDS